MRNFKQKTLCFTTKTPQFHTENPLVLFQKPRSSTPKFFVFRCWTEWLLVLNWGVCWTKGFLVLNWGILGAEKVWSLCLTGELNWEGLCGTEGYSTHFATKMLQRSAVRSNKLILRTFLLISCNRLLLNVLLEIFSTWLLFLYDRKTRWGCMGWVFLGSTPPSIWALGTL